MSDETNLIAAFQAIGADMKLKADKTSIPDVSSLAPKASPTFTGTVSGITKAMVGLDNVDNTADSAKTFSASQVTSGVFARARLGSGTADASTVLYGDGTWKAAPSGGGGSTDWASITGKPTFAPVATSGSYADLTARPTIPDITPLAPKASPTFTGTVSGITKAMVGLGNVDNTADTAKAFAASQITSGVFARARLGTGTADATTILYGDGTWKAAPSGGGEPTVTDLTTVYNTAKA